MSSRDRLRAAVQRLEVDGEEEECDRRREWMLSHLALSTSALALIVIIVVLKHVGLVGAVFRRVRSRERSRAGKADAG